MLHCSKTFSEKLHAHLASGDALQRTFRLPKLGTVLTIRIGKQKGMRGRQVKWAEFQAAALFDAQVQEGDLETAFKAIDTNHDGLVRAGQAASSGLRATSVLGSRSRSMSK